MENYGFKKKEIIERKIALKKLLKNSSFCDEKRNELLDSLDICNNILSIFENEQDEHSIESNIELINYIKSKIEERNTAKQNKDYALADSIREELLSKGIEIKDTREGTTYKVL